MQQKRTANADALTSAEALGILQRSWPSTPYLIDRLFLPAVVELQAIGPLFDTSEKLESLESDLHDQIDAARMALEALAGYEINPDSPAQVRKLLFEELGLPIGQRSKKTGLPSADKGYLAEADHPVADMLSLYREAKKLDSTYIKVLPQNAAAHNGRIRTSYNNTRVETGRLSSGNRQRDPLSVNMQNIPKRGALGGQLRQFFIAPEGSLLYAIDASQFQLRIAAVDAKDEAMIEAFARGGDYHAQTSIDLFGHTAYRALTKHLNFAMLFGASLARVIRTAVSLGLAPDRGLVEEAYGLFFEKRPQLARRVQEVHKFVAKYGYVDDWFGRRNVYDLSGTFGQRSHVLRESYNMMVQGPEASVVKLASAMMLRRIARAGLNAPLVIMVHDEIVFEVRKNVAEEFEGIIAATEREINELLQWPVPVVLDVGKGPNWGVAH